VSWETFTVILFLPPSITFFARLQPKAS